MKLLVILLATMVSLSGCGLIEDMGRQCGGSLEQVCHMIFGYNSTDIAQNEDDIGELKKRLLVLEAEMNSSISLINVLQSDIAAGNAVSANIQIQIDALQDSINSGNGNIAALQAQIVLLQAQIDAGNATVSVVEGQINTLQNAALQSQADIIQLQSEDRVVEYVDPCGDGPGYDEILLRTSSNKLVVYFEDGGKRFLTLLTPGNYRTTDRQACNFTVLPNMDVVY